MTALFPDPQPSQERGPCQWCSAPSVKRVVVEPAIFTATGGVRRLKKHAIEADVCGVHAAMVARNIAQAQDEADAKAALRKARK